MTLNFTLWAFIGVESASVSAGVVKNPKKNVPIATIGGVILAAVCYVLSSSVIMGMIPNHALANSSAPFADAARLAFGEIAGNGVAICAALGCLGSLAGWTLLVGQSAKLLLMTVCSVMFLPVPTLKACLLQAWLLLLVS